MNLKLINNLVLRNAKIARFEGGRVTYLPASKTLHQAAHNHKPAIDQHEEDDLEGQGDNDRWEHHHAHGHQYRGDDHVDDEEGNENQEAYLKCSAEFADHERRYQNSKRHFLSDFCIRSS